MSDLSKALEYGASAIHEALGAEKHRLNVSQYLGSDDVVGIENQLFEILDNSIDECLEYRYRLKEALSQSGQSQQQNTTIELPPMGIYFEITPNDEVIIRDQGRGIPVTLHKTSKQPTIFIIYESDSAGGKGNLAQGGYKSATAGMHGAGAAVSKSCTSTFTVTTATMGEEHEDGTIEGRGIYRVTYKNGERVTDIGDNGLVHVSELSPSQNEVLRNLGMMDTGTEVRYKYDETIFNKTFNGQPSEAYKKDSIVERLRYILLGVEDKSALQVFFKFKDEEIQTISPTDFTPEIFLNANSSNDFIAFPKITSMLDRSDPKWFDCSLYLYKANTGFHYETKTVVNRLSLDSAQSNEIVLSCLREMYNDNVSVRLEQDQQEHVKGAQALKRSAISRLLDTHRVLIVMNLNKAKFDGQTKKNLKSTEYIGEFRALVRSRLSEYVGSFFYKYIQAVQSELNAQIEGLIYTEKKKKKELEKRKASQSIKQAIDDAVSVARDPLKRLKHHMELYDSETKTMLTLKETLFPVNDSWLVLVEGASAAGALGQVDDLPITVVGLQGKIANVTGDDNVAVTKEQIKSLTTQFAMGYKAIGIMTDADSDGMHIRILILAAIMKFIPDYIKQGRVFIINSPNAKLYNNTDHVIYVKVYNRTYSYPPRTPILTKTPAETEKLLSLYGPNGTMEPNGVFLNEKYGGLADSTTDKDTNISLIDLLQDPDYRSQLAIPSQEEVAILNDILSSDSSLKKDFANKLCTSNMRYIKNYSNVNERVKLHSLNLFSQSFTSTPNIEEYKLYDFNSVSYRDLND